MKAILLLGAKSQSIPLESVPDELSRLKQCFTQSSLDLKIEYEPYLTKDLLAELLRHHIDNTGIIHFAGHSNASQLETNDQSVYSHHIADHLKTWNTPPKLVFLNGCHNAAQVEGFLNAGVACVIATHNAVDDSEAARFATEFYTNLLDKPDKVSINNAFKRSGSVVLMGEPRKARSLNLEELELNPTQEWDWSLYCDGSDNADEWTLQPKPLPTLDFIRSKKLEQAQQRWELLFERLTGIKNQHALETRSEERTRMKYIIGENQKELNEVEQEIDTLYRAE